MAEMMCGKSHRTEVKICGLTNVQEVGWVVEEKADYAGFVLFFPKSKRNISTEQAQILLEELKKRNGDEEIKRTKSVAVVVSPTKEQICRIEGMGFERIQIHGEIPQDAADMIGIPVIRALHIPEQKDGEAAVLQEKLKEQMKKERECFGSRLEAFLFDAARPGSGKMFDWNMLREIRAAGEKTILAGGLDPSNVSMAVNSVCPDVVDVSSGVELSRETIGKDREKIREFIRKVRTDE